MKNMRWIVALSLVAVVSATLVAAEVVKLEGITCLFADKPAKADKSVDYKEGKVYFCCDNCPKEFAKDPAKHAAKANKQLVASGQYVQKGCPFSGGKLKDGTAVKVAGLDVSFCCDDCKAKVVKTADADKVELVFNDKAFDKGFEVAKKK